MKKQSNQIIIVIIAFLVGIFAASLFNRADDADVMDETIMEEGEMPTEGTEESADPIAAAPAGAQAVVKTTTPTGNTTYSGGTCVPSLSGMKDSTFNAILLTWTPCKNLSEFQFYKLVRSETNASPSYPGDGVVLSSSNKDLANHIDKTVARAHTYHYRICVVQRLAKTSCSNSVTVSY